MTAIAAPPRETESIPPPPLDPGLRSLDLALAPGRATELLAESLLRPGYELTGCRPCYLRYKPGQSCLVQYRLDLRSDHGHSFVRLAHARLYAGGRAERIWSRGRVQALAARVDPDCALQPAAYVAGLGAILQSYPLDVDLPALTRLGSLSRVRYKPARKALLRDGQRLYAKIYADDRGAGAFETGRALEAAGAPVVKPYSYSQGLRVLTHPAIPGVPLASLRGNPGYEQILGEAGQALSRLHSAAVPDLPRHSWRAELSAAASAVGAAFPKLGRDAARLSDRLGDALAARETSAVTAHGDFYDDQLLVTRQGVLVIDLDRAALADPALDLGTFLAHGAVRGVEERAHDAFMSGYELTVDGRSTALAEAAALLKLAVAPFRTLEPSWPDEVERRVLLAKRRLADATPAGRPSRDEALPHLGQLLDPVAAGRLLAELYREPVAARTVELVRHRPGRRCTLRYELSIGGRRERVYAKTYASGRAPRAHAALAAVAAAGRGTAVSIPEPVGCIPRLRLVVQREVRGKPATSRLLAGDEALAAQVASVLHALHACPAALVSTHSSDDELRILSGRLLELPRRLFPVARACFDVAADAMRRSGWRLRPVHRDLYPEQVLVEGDRLALVDLDDAALSEPAVDVANFLAHLRLLSLDEPRSIEPLEAVAAAFESRYALLDPDLDPALVRVLEATTLLRLAPIHLPRRGEKLAERLIAAGRTLLEETT